MVKLLAQLEECLTKAEQTLDLAKQDVAEARKVLEKLKVQERLNELWGKRRDNLLQ
jgi:hypothetical protein